MINVAIQGEIGSFHHLAASNWFKDDINVVVGDSFKEVFECIKNKTADYGVVAIENSLYGSINEVYDLLLKYKIPIIGEVTERIHQCLIGTQDSSLETITAVHTHPVALTQCSDYLDNKLPKLVRQESYDTAGSVRLVMEQNNPKIAAIASQFAANLYGAKVLQKNIQNHNSNYTRFLVVSNKPLATKANKASLVIETDHQPGSLYKVLSILDKYKINMTKLQSRPIPHHNWRYMFYVDLEINDENLQLIIKESQQQNAKVTLLGFYIASSPIDV